MLSWAHVRGYAVNSIHDNVAKANPCDLKIVREISWNTSIRRRVSEINNFRLDLALTKITFPRVHNKSPQKFFWNWFAWTKSHSEKTAELLL